MSEDLKLEQVLNFLLYHSYKKISLKDYHIIKYWEWYEISSINAFLNFKKLYIDLFKWRLLHISLKDYITPNSELKKIFNKYKIWLISNKLVLTSFSRQEFFDTNKLFDDERLYDFFEKKWAYLDLDINIRINNWFIYNLFLLIKKELWIWDKNKDDVWKDLYEEINKTILWKKTYSWEIEIAYILDDFIYWDNKYIYYLLNDLENKKYLKIKNIIIFDWKIKFIISDFVEISKDLFTNIWSDENWEIKFILNDIWCDLVYLDEKATFSKTEKPFKIIKRFFKDWKTKPMNLSSLFKLLYWEEYQRSLHKDHIISIENIIKWINKKVKPLNNQKQYFSFKGQVLQIIEK